VPPKRSFWVLSRQIKEVSSFGPMRVPAKFKTAEEAKLFCRELNFRKGIYHPGYFVEERIGDTPVKLPAKKKGDTEESE
jgi:hypothetical protein